MEQPQQESPAVSDETSELIAEPRKAWVDPEVTSMDLATAELGGTV